MEIDLLAETTAVDVMSDGDGGDADTSPVYCGIDIKYRESSDGDTSTFLITTPNKDRHGTIIDPKGINVTFYKKNPVVKWDHGWDFTRGDLPIARTVNLTRSDDGWLATVQWWKDEFSKNVRAMVKEKFLQAASVGIIPVKREWIEEDDGSRTLVYKKSELLEFSVVCIGSNRESLAKLRGLAPAWMRELNEKVDGLEAAIRSGKVFAGIDMVALAAGLEKKDHSPAEAKAEAAPDDSAAADTSTAAALSVPEQPQDEGGSAEVAKATAAAKPETGMVGRFIQLSTSDIVALLKKDQEETRRAAQIELKRQLGRA